MANMEDLTTILLLVLLGSLLVTGPILVGGLINRKMIDHNIRLIMPLSVLSMIAGWGIILYAFFIIPDPTYEIGMIQPLEASATWYGFHPSRWLFGFSFVLMILWFGNVAIAVAELTEDLSQSKAALIQLFGTLGLMVGQIWIFFDLYDNYITVAYTLSVHKLVPAIMAEEEVFSWTRTALPFVYPAAVSVLLGGLCVRKTKGECVYLSKSLPFFYWSILIGTLLGLSEATTKLKTLQTMQASLLALERLHSQSLGYMYMEYGMAVIDKILLGICGSSGAILYCWMTCDAPRGGIKIWCAGCKKEVGEHHDPRGLEAATKSESVVAGKLSWQMRYKLRLLFCFVLSAYLFGISIAIYRPTVFKTTTHTATIESLPHSGPDFERRQWHQLFGASIFFFPTMTLMTLPGIIHFCLEVSQPQHNENLEDATAAEKETLDEKKSLLEAETENTYGTWPRHGALRSPLDTHLPV